VTLKRLDFIYMPSRDRDPTAQSPRSARGEGTASRSTGSRDRRSESSSPVAATS